MTLTHPSSPNASELIGAMIPNIQENLSYLDSSAKKYDVQLIEFDFSGLGYIYTGYQTVNDVGFEPSAIIFNAIGGTSSGTIYPIKCFGVYGNSDGSKNRCIFVDRRPYGGYSLKSSNGFSIVFYDSTSGYDALATGQVSQTHSDGFIIFWRKTGYGTLNYTAQIVATCFK